jgi:hypothetical protein
MGRNCARIQPIQTAPASQQGKGDKGQPKAEPHARNSRPRHFRRQASRRHLHAAFQANSRHQIERHTFCDGLRYRKIGPRGGGQSAQNEKENNGRQQCVDRGQINILCQ